MKVHRKILLLFLLAACIFALNAAAVSPEQLYRQAVEKMKSTSYKAVRTNNGITKEIYSRSNPDGTTDKRTTTAAGPKTTLTLQNSQGRFLLYPDQKIAIRLHVEPQSGEVFDRYTTWSITEGEHQGIPCYIVNREIAFSEASLRVFREMLPEDIRDTWSASKIRQTFQNEYPRHRIYHIGKDNLFIYAAASYTGTGKFLSESSYDRVEWNPSMKSDLFELPLGFTVKRAYDTNDLSSLIGDVSTKQLEQERQSSTPVNSTGITNRLLQQTQEISSHLWEGLLSYGGDISLVIAIVLLAAIGILKWKQHTSKKKGKKR